jgi:hypothetical protein
MRCLNILPALRRHACLGEAGLDAFDGLRSMEPLEESSTRAPRLLGQSLLIRGVSDDSRMPSSEKEKTEKEHFPPVRWNVRRIKVARREAVEGRSTAGGVTALLVHFGLP